VTSIERTAYPRFKRLPSARELHVFYTPQPGEVAWARGVAGSDENLEVDDADVAHVGPTVTEHISVHGRYYYDLDRLPKGLRPAPARRLEPQPRPSTANRRSTRAQRDGAEGLSVDLRRCLSDGHVGF